MLEAQQNSGVKRCTKCGEVKPLDEFHKDRQNHSNGRVAQCKVCTKKRMQRYYEKNKTQIIARIRKYEQLHQQEVASRHHKYYLAHREEIIARSAQWHKENPEKVRIQNAKWNKNHPEKMREIVNRRRARKVAAIGSHTSKDFIELCRSTEWKCLCCDTPHTVKILTEDHIVPLSKGGTDNIDNIQPLCRSCNSSKGVKIIDYR